MEQAGVDSVQLIENKELFVLFNELEELVQIASGGEILSITSEFPKNLSIQTQRNNNGKISYNYELDFIELDFSTIAKIKKSIYGFLPVMKMNDKTTRVLLHPLKYNSANQENNISASYSTKISNFVQTDKALVKFNPDPIPWILETGFWDDDGYWLDNQIWID